MADEQAQPRIKMRVTVSAVVHRNDGTTEDLGVIAQTDEEQEEEANGDSHHERG